MEMTGQERIPANRQAVWRFLNDPDILRRAIPGCQALEMNSPGELTVTVKLKIGPVSASFSGNVVLSNVCAPVSYTISAEGAGGVAGFAHGSADVELFEDDDGQTLLSYVAQARIGGKLGFLGSRLVDSTAKKLVGQFFAELGRIISQEAGA